MSSECTSSPLALCGSQMGKDGPSKRAARGVAGRVLVHTVRLRLCLVYGSLFLLSGAGLLAVTYLLVDGLPLAPAPGYRGRAIPAHSGNIPAAISAERASVLHGLLFRSAIALGIMAVVSFWLGWLVAGRVLRPIRTITATARRISEENLHERLALAGASDELKELGDTIDDLLARLEGAFDSQRHAVTAQRAFVANASHELRTPLAMMRTSLDVATRKSRVVSDDARVLAGKVRRGLDQADRLLEGFLVLARAQHGALADLQTVRLPNHAEAALEARASEIGTRRLSVQTALDDAEVVGNETLLARMVANVVDNAVRHNDVGRSISIATSSDDRSARLVVESGGARLDQCEIDQLVEPFRRLGTERTASEGGVGLGLSIVAAIAAAHGGTLDLRARRGGGLRLELKLPRTASSPEIGSEREGSRRRGRRELRRRHRGRTPR